MKTPLDTAEIAGLVQGFLLEKNIKVARCDALELAARIKGGRNLHQDQATGETETTVAPLTNADACLFFQMVGLQFNAHIGMKAAVANTTEFLAPSAKWLPAFITKRIEEDGARLWEILRELGFPRFISDLAEGADRDGSLHGGLAAIVHMLEKAEKTLPVLSLHIPQKAA